MNDLSKDTKIIHMELEGKTFINAQRNTKKRLIRSAVERLPTRLYEIEQYPDVYTKAASMMESIARWHIFADGNKRTGLLSTFCIHI